MSTPTRIAVTIRTVGPHGSKAVEIETEHSQPLTGIVHAVEQALSSLLNEGFTVAITQRESASAPAPRRRSKP